MKSFCFVLFVLNGLSYTINIWHMDLSSISFLHLKHVLKGIMWQYKNKFIYHFMLIFVYMVLVSRIDKMHNQFII